MNGMVHTAKRLIPYSKNKVIHIEAVKDPVLLRMLKDKRVLPHIRTGLKQVDSQYEVLIPYRVDDEEAQLKRYIQWKLGTTVNMTLLRREHLKYYLRLYDYGSPVDVIRRWGLTPIHDSIRSEGALIEALEAFKDETGTVTGIYKEDIYRTVRYFAKKAGKSVADYLESLGIKYRRNEDG